MNKEELKEDFPQGLIIHDGKYFPKMLFPQLPLPKGIFKNENFPNVEFPNRQLPKSVLAAAVGPPSPSARSHIAAWGPQKA